MVLEWAHMGMYDGHTSTYFWLLIMYNGTKLKGLNLQIHTVSVNHIVAGPPAAVFLQQHIFKSRDTTINVTSLGNQKVSPYCSFARVTLRVGVEFLMNLFI